MHTPIKPHSGLPQRARELTRRSLSRRSSAKVPITRQSPDFLEILERILPVPDRRPSENLRWF